jgi:pimeloyl-ACP methyl ester carboxylesterase
MDAKAGQGGIAAAKAAARSRFSPGADEVDTTEHRNQGADAAIVFIHGFGSAGNPFGMLPALLASEPALAEWDIYELAYNTGLLPDFRGLWAADPDIPLLATYLRSRATLEPIDRYRSLAFVAHSMGGLVVQRGLLDDPELVARASHVFMFGTPSGGLKSGRLGRFFKRQVADMAIGGPFITDLRQRWDDRFATRRPFDLWVVAGDRDEFVPATSSLGPFPTEVQLVAPGNHTELVNVLAPGTMTEQIVSEGLIGNAAPAGPWNSARVAIERREFEAAIAELMPNADRLDERHLVELALALDASGRRDEAISLLEKTSGLHGTDVKGTLAGRHKRNWIAEGLRDDGEAALDLYSQSLAEALAADDHDQAYYHAINVAFLQLAYKGDHAAARAAAQQALDEAAQAEPGFWRGASEAEARLYLGDIAKAVEGYRSAVALKAEPHELESAYAQASRVAAELDDETLQEQLNAVFRPEAMAPAGPVAPA